MNKPLPDLQVLQLGETGTLLRVAGRDEYWQPKKGASWICCRDQHHIGQRSLKFMRKLALDRATRSKDISKDIVPPELICAVEFGYKCCEKGLNIQATIEKFCKVRNG